MNDSPKAVDTQESSGLTSKATDGCRPCVSAPALSTAPTGCEIADMLANPTYTVAAAPTGEIGEWIAGIDYWFALATERPWDSGGFVSDALQGAVKSADYHFIMGLVHGYPNLKAALTLLQASLVDAQREREIWKEEAIYNRTFREQVLLACDQRNAAERERDELKQQLQAAPADGFARVDTPRTDAAECTLQSFDLAKVANDTKVVYAAFARQLERELAEKAAEVERLVDLINTIESGEKS
jgi:hypothetical protein